eukprot:10197104-Alexandrium_andersonii.AAC.1
MHPAVVRAPLACTQPRATSRFAGSGRPYSACHTVTAAIRLVFAAPSSSGSTKAAGHLAEPE